MPETIHFHSSYWRLICREPFEFGWFPAFAAGAEEYTAGPRKVVAALSSPLEEAVLAELAARLRGEPEGTQRELFPVPEMV